MKRSVLILLVLLISVCFAQAQKGFYRFPTIQGDTIVFTSEGDLWRVGLSGGEARRLTTHQSMETHAAISPDGQTVAFSGQYEGPTEVYTMPIQGGLPVRITYEGERALVVGWTPDGKILYSTRHYSTLPNTQLAIIDPNTLEQRLVPLSQASDGVFENTGKTLFFTRLPFQGSRTKRYAGGTAQNLWKFTDGTSEATPLTNDYAGTSKDAMWWDGRVYFVSDRDGTMNLWSMDATGGDLKQLTFHHGWDMQSPALQAGRIVYQLGADLLLFDISSGAEKDLNIALSSDFDQTREKWVKDPMQYLSAVDLAPDGENIVLTARGRVFVAPAKQGRLVEVTRRQGVRYRHGRFLSPTSLLLLSDASGEQEFWRFPANGLGPGKQLTRDATVLRIEGVPSPKGKKFAFTDKDQRLSLHDMATRRTEVIATSDWANYSGLSWSPDGQWLAYVETVENLNARIMIYNVTEETKTAVTSDRVDSKSPAWSPDGKWLYFLSDRNFQSLVRSPWGARQPEPFYDKTTKIYVVSLSKGERFPFQPNDEIFATKSEKDKKSGPDKDKKQDESDSDEEVQVKIDLSGLANRVMEVPVDAGNYDALSVNSERLFWTDHETSVKRKRNLIVLEIGADAKKPESISDNIEGYELSQNGKKLLIQKKDNLYIIDASAGSSVKLDENKVDLSSWTFAVDPREEWRQMFTDAWRLERDYFYDPGLHGLDWREILDKHLPLVERVSDRSELNDLIAQMVGELSALHTFVVGGDQRRDPDRVGLASLGAALRRDEQAGGYRVAHIYRSEADYLERLAPLARADVDIHDGDVILQINGEATLSVPHPGILLKNQGGRQVFLKVKSAATGKIFDAVVKPILAGAEAGLRYDEWEYTRRMQVENMGAGEIGYVHLRAMGGGNYAEWVRNFYPVFNRKGLIIDVRHNRGGNIDSWILEKLLRKAWFYWQGRVGKPTWNMQYAFRGHLVVLCNERTASDGEAFTEGFRRLGLGKVIGTRTWGGEIWLSFSNRLVDRGIASAAEFGVYGQEGKWLIEGHGVDPDIVVDNPPHATFNGEDAQLVAAIKHLQALIRTEPRPVPPPPPYPDKSFDYEKLSNSSTRK